jgi:DNA-binding transcriptional regulator LsrR (DeoR family)
LLTPAHDQRSADSAAEVPAASRFPPDLLVLAAQLYYVEDATQAQVAQRLGVSRPTVSRLLTEARRQGIVRIQIVPPPAADDGLSMRVKKALGLRDVRVVDTMPGVARLAALAPAVGDALIDVGLDHDDILLVSSGRTIHEVAQAGLPRLAAVRVAPTIGGMNEPDPWYQPNEITRVIAERVGGQPSFLDAPAMPGEDLYRSLRSDPSIERVLEMWEQARCVVMAVGAPPLTRSSLPRFVPRSSPQLRVAVGDVCSRFYDSRGAAVPFQGSDRLMAIDLDTLARIPARIAVAVGDEKVDAISAGASAGYFDRLVTDTATASTLLSRHDGKEKG